MAAAHSALHANGRLATWRSARSQAGIHSIAPLKYITLTCMHLNISTEDGARLVARPASVGGLVNIRAIILGQEWGEVQGAVAWYFPASTKASPANGEMQYFSGHILSRFLLHIYLFICIWEWRTWRTNLLHKSDSKVAAICWLVFL